MRLYWVICVSLFTLLSINTIFHWDAFAADWAPLWAAGTLAWSAPAMVYDFETVSWVQVEAFRNIPLRPYIYPPSTLLLLAPLAAMPLWPSFAIFSLASLAALAWASRTSDKLLLIASPPVVLAAMAGQPTLLVAALVVAGCLTPNAGRKGILFAVAALIKPQLLILAPVYLLSSRDWPALRSAAATVVIGCALSAALFGLEMWRLWLESLPRFQQLFEESPHLVRTAVTPYAAAVRLGYDGIWALVAGTVIAIPMAALAHRMEPLWTAAAIMGGALLISPYAMFYELAVFAPAIASLPMSKPRDLLVAGLWSSSVLIASVLGLVAAYGRSMCELRPLLVRGQ